MEAQMDRIERKIDYLLATKPGDILRRDELMKMTGTRSDSALDRLLASIGVRPVLKGKYRRIDVETALARRALSNRQLNKN